MNYIALSTAQAEAVKPQEYKLVVEYGWNP